MNIRIGRKAWAWGVLLLLIAGLVLANQFGGFVVLGFWSIAISALAVTYLIHSIVDFRFGNLPIPIAALYYIFQEPLNLPEIGFWTLVLVTLLATAGLTVILPKRKFFRKKFGKNNDGIKVDIPGIDIDIGNSRGINVDIPGVDINIDNEGVNINGETIESFGTVVGETGSSNSKMKVSEGGDENNPCISVQFGSISRYLHSNSLESASLSCSFGSLEVYFDNVTLSPNGADVSVSNKFGAVELYVPKNWTIRGNLEATVGAAEVNGINNQPNDGPELRIYGSSSFGAIEVSRV